MDKLTQLQQANPHIAIRSVRDEAFRHYGNFLTDDTAAICAAAETAVPFPEAGSAYHASVPTLEAVPELDALRETYCGGMDEQFGLCLG